MSYLWTQIFLFCGLFLQDFLQVVFFSNKTLIYVAHNEQNHSNLVGVS